MREKDQGYPFWLFLFCIFMLAVALLLFATYRLEREQKAFVVAIGHAALIATLLAATVDRYLKVRVIREIQVDTAKYLIGFGMPVEVQERIPDMLRRAGVIRKNYEFNCTLRRPPNRQDGVLLTVVATYNVDNFTHENQEITQKLAFNEGDNPVALKLSCDTTDKDACYEFVPPGLSLKPDPVEVGVVVVEAKPRKVKPIHKGFDYCFTSSYSLTLPDNFFELFTFGQLTNGATITVTIECDGVRCFATPTDVSPKTQNENRWEYAKVFLPGEHLRLRWFTEEYLRDHRQQRGEEV